MIQLNPNEKIVLALHRHWIAFIGELIIIVLMLFLPLAGSFFAVNFLQENFSVFYYPFWFLLSVYFLAIYLSLFIIWMDHYLDMWIITNERVLNIEHSGIFKREVSEFLIGNVQDVTIEIPGMLASILKYGDMLVQTAGEKNFRIKQIPFPEKAKDVVMEYSKLTKL